MASIGEPYILASFSTHSKSLASKPPFVVCANAVANSDQTASTAAVVTVQKEGVHIYNTADQQCVQSISVSPNTAFACPAKSRTDGSQRSTYVALMSGADVSNATAGKVLVRWSEAGSLISATAERFTKTLLKPVFAIEAPSELSKHILVIHQDCSVTLLSDDLHKQYETTDSYSSPPLLATSIAASKSFTPFPIPTASIITAVVTRSLELIIHAVETTSNQVTRLSPTRLFEDDVAIDDLVSYRLDLEQGYFFTINTAGLFRMQKLSFKSNAPTGHSLSTKSIILKNLDLAKVDYGSPAAILVLNDGLIGLVAANSDSKQVFTIWDVNYAILQAEKMLRLPSAASTISYSVESLGSEECVITSVISNGNSTKSSVCICPFQASPSSLMSAMNRMDATLQYVSHHPFATQTATATASADDFLSSIAKSDEAALTKLLAIDDPQAFTRAFHDFVDEKRKQERVIEEIVTEPVENDTRQESSADDDDAMAVDKPLVNGKHHSESPVIEINSDSDPTGIKKKDTRAKKAKQAAKRKAAKDRQAALDVKKAEEAVLARQETLARRQTTGPARPYLPREIVSSIAQKCLGIAGSMFATEVLLWLSTKHYLSSNAISGGIIPPFIQARDWQTAIICCKNVQDIPENDLVALLSASLNDVHAPSDQILTVLVMAACDDAAMRAALRTLSGAHVSTLLSKLVNGIQSVYIKPTKDSEAMDADKKDDSLRFRVSRRTTRSRGQPTLAETLDFTGLLLDANLTSVVLSAKSSALDVEMATLRDLISEEAAAERKLLAQLHGPLGVFARAKKQKNVKGKFRARERAQEISMGVPVYSLEELKL